MWLTDYYCTPSSHVSGKNQTNVKHFSVRTKICDQTGVFSAAMQSSLNISSLTVHLNMIVWKNNVLAFLEPVETESYLLSKSLIDAWKIFVWWDFGDTWTLSTFWGESWWLSKHSSGGLIDSGLPRTRHFSKIAVFPVNRRWVDKYSIEFLLFPIRPSVQRWKILRICPRSAEKRRRRLKM